MTKAAADDKMNSFNPDLLYAGSDVTDDMTPEPADRGDLPVAHAPEPAPTPEPATKPEPAPAPVPKVEPEPVPAPAPAAKVEPEPAPAPAPEPVAPEDNVKNRRTFTERLQHKNRLLAERDAKLADLEAKLAAAQAGTPAPAPTSVPAAPAAKDYTAELARAQQLTIDGKFEEAAAIQAKVMADQVAEVKAAAKAEALAEMRQEYAKERDNQSIESVYIDLVTEYPFLDADGDNYDEVVVGAINSMAQSYLQDKKAGYTPATALQTAADTVLKRFGLAKGVPAPAPAATPAPAAPAARTPDPAKVIAAAAAQPAAPATPAARADTAPVIDIFKLSDSQFDALAEADRKRLRGDDFGGAE